MNERPSFTDIFIKMAFLVAERSTCSRLQVGTVITSVDSRQVYAIGYNGAASGLPNQCDSEMPGSCGCLHSECNAIINCNVGRSMSKVVYCTALCCVMCAKMLINLGGVEAFVYRDPYRLTEGLDVLRAGEILVYHYPEMGIKE